MKKFSLFFIILSACFSNCTSESDTSSEVVTIPENYMYLKVNGDTVYSDDNKENLYTNTPAILENDVLKVNIFHGEVGYVWNEIVLYITTEGKLLQAVQKSIRYEYNLEYKNYKNFPSNYFNISNFKMDTESSKVYFKLEGNLYLEEENFDSESIALMGEVKLSYEVITPTADNFILFSNTLNSLEQFCTATLNQTVWSAKMENPYSTFTSTDAYKFEIDFDNGAIAGDFEITPNSTSNHIKFSKFNTSTLEYDYYDLNGILTLSYRENHGGTKNSFKGSFNFVAINPNDPTEIIEVTNGLFTSYQQY